MRRTGNISLLPAIGTKVLGTANGVAGEFEAVLGVAQPITAPAVISAPDCNRPRLVSLIAWSVGGQ